MKNILHVTSSPRGDESISTQLGRAIVSELISKNPGSELVEIDLVNNPFPHLDGKQTTALRTPTDLLTEEQKQLLERSNEAVRQLFTADHIIISLPLHNFGIASVLKSWLDNVIRAGHTFSYSSEGPKGLLSGKKVHIAIATGGIYSDGPMAALDFAVPYLESIFKFIGITDFEVYRAEGLGIPALQEKALEKAIESIAV
ncbi:FMN-dependent NADH-azoreductase [Flavobacterium silvaticum]|uniref:FMN dependent NADH:quinone oxidoreductase n=1 Tax=Flavobacterium silvaticum TaxID=1852020 RepID=A0A972FIH4_9FLAO|nr:FMN-dependent NADH-azoreductase [Flavobacterium silvaticum]NMH26619.1 FMN-dependent NADH-azoreductase [Flavobacterium silvaticum]